MFNRVLGALLLATAVPAYSAGRTPVNLDLDFNVGVNLAYVDVSYNYENINPTANFYLKDDYDTNQEAYGLFFGFSRRIGNYDLGGRIGYNEFTESDDVITFKGIPPAPGSAWRYYNEIQQERGTYFDFLPGYYINDTCKVYGILGLGVNMYTFDEDRYNTLDFRYQDRYNFGDELTTARYGLGFNMAFDKRYSMSVEYIYEEATEEATNRGFNPLFKYEPDSSYFNLVFQMSFF